MSHGVNANIVHRWRRDGREGAGVTPLSVREFVPVTVPASAHEDQADIRIELRRGATTMAITWPAEAAIECATWMRELLR